MKHLSFTRKLLLLALLACSPAVVGCGGTIFTKARQWETGVDIAAKNALNTFGAYDTQHQQDIVAQVKAECASAQVNDPAGLLVCQTTQGKVALDAWNTRFLQVKAAFFALQAALGTVALAIDAAEALQQGQPLLTVILAGLKEPLQNVITALGAAGVPVPPVLAAIIAAM